MIDILLAVLKTLILLGILVIVHEGGHFVVAKLCKVKVNEFSVGFAKDRIMLLTKLSSDISAMDIENSVLNLKTIYDKVINGE